MINIEKFVQARKKLRLSQTELCRGICTQSTLSMFENNGQVPSFKILKQLCERMDIDVSDIMDSSEHKYIAHILFEADFAFINFDYSKIFTLLSQINPGSRPKTPNKSDSLSLFARTICSKK